ncbi:MAG: hypothetical protein LBG79_01860 [Spirochaetaceae bacterium]|jgi:hypothetical protein|nr:hypothetical protein [Spirochaetaceae bacterium]
MNINLKSNKLFKFFIGVIIAFIISAAFFSLFEIRKTKKNTMPKEAAKRNLYLALEHWLEAEGHHVNYFEFGSAADIEKSEIKTILIWSSSFNWNEYAVLRRHIEEGANIIIFIDDEGNEELKNFLSEFNIEYRLFVPFYEEEDEYSEPEDDLNADLDTDVFFKTDTGQSFLITVPHGKGTLTVSGIPFFMQWSNMLKDMENNAALGWNLSGALDTEKKGVLIFRNKRASAAFSREDERGAFWERFFEYPYGTALCFCAFIVILTGFWMNFAPFGKLKREIESTGNSIEERFRAEARFFKKYKVRW